MAVIRKLFIANRGEIAVRIIRTARECGIRTVIGHSEADSSSVAVAMADEAICLGPAEASESYLRIEKVVGAAKSAGADAIHPGYGFLSERAELAAACEAAELVFVGPSAAAMRLLGSKIESKALAQKLGVPLVPGYFKPGATDVQLSKAAGEIGFPVMLKASAGGGGRGMRAVFSQAELGDQLRLASEEAQKAFGDGSMMVEKLIGRPRHIEAQVLADRHGQVAVLFERECSLQRRHQKVIEESPTPFPGFETKIWPGMREAVEKLIRAAGYSGAGTVEFIVDPESGAFYFLEVNTRLQVEHPVTEAITGLDLVSWQLRVAVGERLPDELLKPRRIGHAIEARIIAEDPGAGFLPSVGEILAWAEPRGPGIRVDTGFAAGQSVSRHYDSLIAKLIVHAETRGGAIAKLRLALLDFHILGVQTNIPYLRDVVSHPAFAAGEFDTGFLGREFGAWAPSGELPLGLGALVATTSPSPTGAQRAERVASAWDGADSFRLLRPT
ncbi:MAG TPA: biotin carboxylase N-terminal domain-containing protein [Fimbriimonadaceae bacterium]|nr:biotin carboxylase N-terminal domain-containing protein [Fimbriimonadaceae bacterium]